MGVRKGVYGYPYFNNLIYLWPGYWKERLGDIH